MEKKTPKRVEVELNQAHTHKRKPYKAGDKIEVLPHTAESLKAKGKIKTA